MLDQLPENFPQGRRWLELLPYGAVPPPRPRHLWGIRGGLRLQARRQPFTADSCSHSRSRSAATRSAGNARGAQPLRVRDEIIFPTASDLRPPRPSRTAMCVITCSPLELRWGTRRASCAAGGAWAGSRTPTVERDLAVVSEAGQGKRAESDTAIRSLARSSSAVQYALCSSSASTRAWLKPCSSFRTKR